MREVFLIGANGEPVGLVSTDEALRIAKNAALDLVEVNPNARPPVCKVMDFGKHKYRQKKNAGKQKAHQAKIKEVRLHPDTGNHDVEVRVNQAKKFLEHGDKVLVSVQFKGRELAHREFGTRLLDRFREELAVASKVEKMPSMEGKKMTLLLAPVAADERKKREKAAEEAATSAPGTTDSGRLRRVITLDETKKIADPTLSAEEIAKAAVAKLAPVAAAPAKNNLAVVAASAKPATVAAPVAKVAAVAPAPVAAKPAVAAPAAVKPGAAPAAVKPAAAPVAAKPPAPAAAPKPAASAPAVPKPAVPAAQKPAAAAPAPKPAAPAGPRPMPRPLPTPAPQKHPAAGPKSAGPVYTGRK
jgi:translation initiation factor IF-3